MWHAMLNCCLLVNPSRYDKETLKSKLEHDNDNHNTNGEATERPLQ